MARGLLDFCFPRQCRSCEGSHESATLLCDECEAEMAKLSAAPRCGQCAMPAKEHGAPCPHCMSRGLGPFDRVVCVGVLRDPIKGVIHRAKYSGRWTLGEYLADCALEREGAGYANANGAAVARGEGGESAGCVFTSESEMYCGAACCAGG